MILALVAMLGAQLITPRAEPPQGWRGTARICNVATRVCLDYQSARLYASAADCQNDLGPYLQRVVNESRAAPIGATLTCVPQSRHHYLRSMGQYEA